MSEKNVPELIAALKPLIDALDVGLTDTLMIASPDSRVLFQCSGSWTGTKEVTLGEFRAIRKAYKDYLSERADDNQLASMDWIRTLGLDEDDRFHDQRLFYIRSNDGTCVAKLVVNAAVGGWDTPKLLGGGSFPYGLISDKPTRGQVRRLLRALSE